VCERVCVSVCVWVANSVVLRWRHAVCMCVCVFVCVCLSEGERARGRERESVCGRESL